MKVILLMAVTADGMIARNSMQLIDWTGKADKQYFVDITRKAGAMIMGSKTFDTIGTVLPGRKNIVMTRDKKRKSQDKNLIFTDQTPGQILTDLASQGFDCATLIGGSMVNTVFMTENRIDEIHITIVPRVFGRGLALFNETLDTQLELLGVKEIGEGHVLLRYRVQH
jgi:dihydrofolate reductase